MKIMVVVPVYNEGWRVVNTIRAILENTDRDVVVVDDGSTDESVGVLTRNFGNNRRIHLKRISQNRGKGAAMRVGAREAWRRKAEAVIFIDADGQHDPRLLSKFTEYLERGDEAVIGVRINKTKMSWLRKVGNWMIRVFLVVLYGQTIEDMLCGYRALTKKTYRKIKWVSDRYGVETEMMCNLWKFGVNYRKIVVETIYSEKKIRKKDCFTLVDGMKILIQIPKWWLT